MDVMAAVERRMGGALEWGVSDCTASACSVFADLHGIDPLAPLRGSYNGPVSAGRIIRAAGGMEALADDLARQAGLVRCCEVPGSIGLVRDGTALVAAICVARGVWAVKAQLGFGILKKVMVAWSI